MITSIEDMQKTMTYEEAEETSYRTWYLPHHAVLNSNKPGKVHVVFDGTAKFHGVSLNGELLTRPELLNNFGRISVMADTEQINVPSSRYSCSR